LHIAVEAISLSKNARGMGRYARSLLAEMPAQRDQIRYSIFAKDADDVRVLSEQLAPLPRVMERATILPASQMADVACDVAWYPFNKIAHHPRIGAMVPTIHDLFPMLQLDGRWWKVLKRFRARRRYTRAIASADHIITGATAARDELVAQFGITPDRITVVPHAADDFRPSSNSVNVDALLAKLRVGGPFLLAVGAQESRKNLNILYEALRLLDARGRAIPLVLCGPRSAHGYQHGDATPHWLRHAGFVSDDELAALYARATALVFPSRYEGFGLPVLEALTVGGVVICANASTLPEVGGDAALYFHPDDAQALGAQILRLLDEPALRDTLRAAGVVQAAKFSWARSAVGTLESFDRGIAAHRR
jgi:glycosyltransferase involved in cell wall biosynthesis